MTAVSPASLGAAGPRPARVRLCTGSECRRNLNGEWFSSRVPASTYADGAVGRGRGPAALGGWRGTHIGNDRVAPGLLQSSRPSS